ncbi:MAG: hypothetical protein ACYS8I_08130 [Planctomycetota bacterium]
MQVSLEVDPSVRAIATSMVTRSLQDLIRDDSQALELPNRVLDKLLCSKRESRYARCKLGGARAMIRPAISVVTWISIILTLAGCGTTQSAGQNTGQTPAEDKSCNEERWGIQICGIRLSAADYMLDFRYRVMDPQKAAPLLDRNVKPYLIDQESGAKLIVPTPPKVGSLRQKSNEPVAGKIYFIMFSNPGRLVRKGNKVAVVIGHFRAESLTVE